MAANKIRGEVEVELAGTTYVLRPTMEAISRIESELGMGTLALTRRALSGEGVGHNTFIPILFYGILAGSDRDLDDPPITREQIGEALIKEGLSSKMKVVLAFLSSALGGTNKRADKGKKEQEGTSGAT